MIDCLLTDGISIAFHGRKYMKNIRLTVESDFEEIWPIVMSGSKIGVFSPRLLEYGSKETYLESLRKSLLLEKSYRELWNEENTLVDAKYWTYEKDGHIAGILYVMGDDAPFTECCELHAIVVHEKLRNKGIGSDLFNFFCNEYSDRKNIIACYPGTKIMRMATRRGFLPYNNTKTGYILMQRNVKISDNSFNLW